MSKPKQPEEWYKPEHLVRLTKDEAKFILEQSEKQLKETIDTGNIVVTRTTTLLTIAAGLLTALVGFSINRWETKLHAWDTLLQLSCIVAIYILAVIIVLSLNIFGHTYYTTGSEPKPLLHDTFFSYPDTTNEQRIIHYYRNEFFQYQGRIEKNKRLNRKRWRKFKIAFIMTLATPLFITLIYFWITRYCCWGLCC
jgi:hypothetical protein